MDVYIIGTCTLPEAPGPAFHWLDEHPAVATVQTFHTPMPAFASKPLNRSPLYRRLKRNPALFGVPFLLVMVGASFGLQSFTQTRYDLHSQKVTQVRVAPPFSYKRGPLFNLWLAPLTTL